MDINAKQVCKCKGCGNTFTEKDNHESACNYHPGPAIFHDRLRGVRCFIYYYFFANSIFSKSQNMVVLIQLIVTNLALLFSLLTSRIMKWDVIFYLCMCSGNAMICMWRNSMNSWKYLHAPKAGMMQILKMQPENLLTVSKLDSYFLIIEELHWQLIGIFCMLCSIKFSNLL